MSYGRNEVLREYGKENKQMLTLLKRARDLIQEMQDKGLSIDDPNSPWGPYYPWLKDYKKLVGIKEETLTVDCAAIRSADEKTVYSVPRPGRHHNVIRMMVAMGAHDPRKSEQGFVLSNGQFVSRSFARIIAEEAGQLLSREAKQDILYSEDVW